MVKRKWLATKSVPSVGMCTAGCRFPQGNQRSKDIPPNKNTMSQPQTTSVTRITTHTRRKVLFGRVKDRQQRRERVAQMSPKKKASSCSIVKRLIAQSKAILHGYVIPHDSAVWR